MDDVDDESSRTTKLGLELFLDLELLCLLLKLKEIDGEVLPGVEPVTQFNSTQKTLPGPNTKKIDIFRAIGGCYCLDVLSCWADLSG